MEEKHWFNLRVSKELHQALRACANVNGRSMSKQAIIILCESLKVDYKETETKIKGE